MVAEVLVAFLLLLALLKLADVSSFVRLAADLPSVSDYGSFIELTIPGLDRYGAPTAVVLTGIIAAVTGWDRHPYAAHHKGSTTFGLAVPGVAVALAGAPATLLAVVLGGVAGVLITRSRNEPYGVQTMNLIVWVVVTAGIYGAAFAFANA